MITLEDISLNYDENLILDRISLTVNPGDTVALIGPSGCGKSSLLNVIAGLNRDYSGKALIDGEKINPRKQTIGYIPQNYGLLPWLTVEENIMLGLKIKEKNKAELPIKLIEEVGLTPYLKRYPRELSGGQQQRVSLLRAFSLKADVLLMDEPFSALDTITREEMQNVFMKLWQEGKPATLLVTHFVEEAIYLGKYIVIMSGNPGKIYKIVANPLFADADFRLRSNFLSLANGLREELKRVVKNEN